ncbi:leukocyte elastase inhibitor-like [Bufo gargarizans]|uniref:leukocyte elastase inhibitor-like n=1 Tax=Bufo gargarizans TaxID=30331 RepID=UPI001CF33F45|nr:leukocyte elastase inhibitor-like [Bufo gargarizans]XP_044148957.1 leukocyte elastase inhibitor-like [Bufo gargarizans]
MDICASNNQLAVDVLREIGGSNVGQNIVFAPLSIVTALSMVYLGARGNTAAQMSKVLHFSDDKEVHSNYKNLMRELAGNGNDYIMMNVNKLFGGNTFQFHPTFVNDTENLYDARLEKLDFLNNPEASRKCINDWITQQTRGKIQQLLPDKSISESTVLVLANILYFAANWTKPFNQMKTYKAPFTKMSNEQVMVDMMHMTSYFNVKYITDPGIKVLELPYGASQNFTMVIIVPDNNSVFKQVEQEISLKKLNKWMSNSEMKMMNVLVHLPKIKIEKSFSMKNILSSLGMLDAFSQTKANFSGMTEQRDIFMSEVYHKTFLEINEKGTEAASSTASVMSVRSFPGEEVKGDRPFYYFIKHKSKCIVLCGIVYEP